MSNALAIAATTATLRNLLLAHVPLIDSELADLEVTTQPPDLARKTVTKAQLNLFLYQTVPNAAWRNRDPWPATRPGETAFVPLALDLNYLLTAYGRGESDNEAVSHRALGCAMGLFNDHALLGPDEIAAALSGNDLGDQIERVRITPLALGVEEMSKLWTTFQTQYRVSCAWQVGVILIDSRRAPRMPLPVLRRGADDRGPLAVADLPPVLRELRLERSQSAARLGEAIVLIGDNLGGAGLTAVFDSPLQIDPIELPVEPDGAGGLRVALPDVPDDAGAAARWHPGFHRVALVQTRPDAPPIVSNALAFALAPRIAVDPFAPPPGDFALSVTCTPRLRDGQRIALIFGDRQLPPETTVTPADPAQPSTLSFAVRDFATGPYVVRLRVDGADSIPVILTGDPPQPAFDPAQTVAVP